MPRGIHMKGRKMPKEIIEKIRLANTGKKRTAEVKELFRQQKLVARILVMVGNIALKSEKF